MTAQVTWMTQYPTGWALSILFPQRQNVQSLIGPGVIQEREGAHVALSLEWAVGGGGNESAETGFPVLRNALQRRKSRRFSAERDQDFVGLPLAG
jgi:hypothetical protein